VYIRRLNFLYFGPYLGRYCKTWRNCLLFINWRKSWWCFVDLKKWRKL